MKIKLPNDFSTAYRKEVIEWLLSNARNVARKFQSTLYNVAIAFIR